MADNEAGQLLFATEEINNLVQFADRGRALTGQAVYNSFMEAHAPAWGDSIARYYALGAVFEAGRLYGISEERAKHEPQAPLAERLKQLRGSRSLEEVSKGTGIPIQVLEDYEAGKRRPKDANKLKLVTYYGMEPGTYLN